MVNWVRKTVAMRKFRRRKKLRKGRLNRRGVSLSGVTGLLARKGEVN
jgi:hypothetical protein